MRKIISGWWFQPLWKIWKSMGRVIPYITEKTCLKPPTSWFMVDISILNYYGYKPTYNWRTPPGTNTCNTFFSTIRFCSTTWSSRIPRAAAWVSHRELVILPSLIPPRNIWRPPTRMDSWQPPYRPSWYVIYVIQLTMDIDHLVVWWTPKHPSRIAPVDDDSPIRTWRFSIEDCDQRVTVSRKLI